MTAVARLTFEPDLLAVHRASPQRWPYLLASTAGHERLGRWSMLLRRSVQPPIVVFPGQRGSFLDALEIAWQRRPPHAQQGLPEHLPFIGGWFLYLGYELAAEVEPKLALPPSPGRLPTALAQRCPVGLIQDHANGAFWLMAESPALLDEARSELDSMTRTQASTGPNAAGRFDLTLEAAPATEFIQGVCRILEYILDGDVFQVNLSRRWTGRAAEPIDPSLVHARLTGSNAAPFAGLARLPGGAVVSSSPERLVTVDRGVVQTRPIAGTRPRGSSRDGDRRLSDELMTHPKERSEHIMLIDLERNDLGRVCEPGSVEVDQLMVLESYAHVHHIVSNVRGRMREGLSPIAALRAVFPGGTVTGCPKVRCMQIIAELEGEGRGFYTGAMGYLGLDGRMDLNILIRSLLIEGRELSFRTGAGIVADSDPDAELAETQAKAQGLLEALGNA